MTLTDRLRAIDWAAVTQSLDHDGFALTDAVYSDAESDELDELFDAGSFRSTIDMESYRFGEGLYRYFDRPLPALIEAAREELYAPLAELGNLWSERLGQSQRYPARLEDFLALPRSWAGPAHALDPPIRTARPQHAPPGHLR